MKKTDCSLCNGSIPVNDSIKVDNTTHCSSCFDATFTEENMLQNKVVTKEHDPTVCSFCQKDFDTTELEKISQYPICTDCIKDVKNKTFPLWVKGFFAAVLLLVAFSFFWNWKYYTAYKNIQTANELFQTGNFKEAGKEMAQASAIVPEVQDLEILSSYYNGIALLNEDKNVLAIKEFNKCKDALPPDYDVDYLLLQARIGVAFDSKDYEGFLANTKELMKKDSTSVYSCAAMASAYACIYVDKADEEAKKKAYDYLQRAKNIDSVSVEAKGYYSAIEYRIDSRKIIKREEFDKQFPNGWVKS